MTSQARPDAFGVDAIFANSWELFKKRFWLLLWIAVVSNLLTLVGEYFVGGFTTTSGAVIMVLGYLLVLWGLVAAVYALVYEKKSLTVSSAFGASLPYLPGYFAVSMLSVLAIALGLVLLLVPGILLMVWLSFATYIYVAEDTGVIESLTRSKAYVTGRWWAVLGRSLLLSLVGLGVMIGILVAGATVLFGSGALFGETAAVAVFVVLTSLATILLANYGLAYSVSMYKGIREAAKA